jgi:hypothetical protein
MSNICLSIPRFNGPWPHWLNQFFDEFEAAKVNAKGPAAVPHMVESSQ